MKFLRGFALLTTALLAACAVGPNLYVPEVDVGARYLVAAPANGVAVGEWWTALEDPILVGLIEETLANSPGLRAARERLMAARAERRVAQSVFWPTVGGQTSYTRFEQSLQSAGAIGQLVAAGLAERDGDFFSASVDANWELDVFGGLRRQNEAAAAVLNAETAAFDGTKLVFVAETASAYFEHLGASARIDALTRNIDLLEQSAQLARNRQRVGLGREVDALRAETALAAAAAQLPQLQAAKDASLNRLGVLVGLTPVVIRARLEAGSLPQSIQSVDIGTPADLLRRRPDIARARFELARATAAIGVAQARFFPRLALNASWGFESVAVSSLGDSAARTTGLVPFLEWPILNGGRLRAQYRASNRVAAAAALQYEEVVLQALAESETALSAYAAARDTEKQLAIAAASARAAQMLARKLYENGLTAFIDVLDAERSQTDLEDQLALARTQTLLRLVQLYKALGGGWSPAGLQS